MTMNALIGARSVLADGAASPVPGVTTSGYADSGSVLPGGGTPTPTPGVTSGSALVLPIRPGGIFTVREARALGVSPEELADPALQRPLRGVRSFSQLTELADRCRAVLAVAPPGSAISHITAAHLHGLWLPTIEDGPVHIIRPAETGRVRRPQVRDHEGQGGRKVVELDGLPVVAPADTWADLHSTLTLPNLVAAGDGIAQDLESLESLRHALAWRQSKRYRGVVRVRNALGRVRVGSRSRLESMTRWVVVNGGLPEPELKFRHRRPGRHLAGHRRPGVAQATGVCRGAKQRTSPGGGSAHRRGAPARPGVREVVRRFHVPRGHLCRQESQYLRQRPGSGAPPSIPMTAPGSSRHFGGLVGTLCLASGRFGARVVGWE
ncbi:hypothetical protein BJY21_001020 [Kineosphaera limosa]|uniref:hypothetical protein n=1 Tax=Kineosphaera limosa TaxID=111564 RepID=UPI0012FBE080|nr:hypothetical protein [Kineosphaera limosa]NYD99835.1 hypothetical protein [Kineosphaera limosa]